MFFRIPNGCRFRVNADEILPCDHLNYSLLNITNRLQFYNLSGTTTEPQARDSRQRFDGGRKKGKTSPSRPFTSRLSLPFSHVLFYACM